VTLKHYQQAIPAAVKAAALAVETELSDYFDQELIRHEIQ